MNRFLLLLVLTSTMGLADSAKPVPGNEAIQEVLARYQLTVPEKSLTPIYKPDLYSLSSTFLFRVIGVKQAFIGPKAFSSWNLLAAVVAHELEEHSFVHLRKKGQKIKYLDICVYDNSYQLRFNLTDDEVDRLKASFDE